MGKPSIFTFCVRGFPGTNRALTNLERTAGLSKHFILTSANKEGPEVKFFANYIKAEKPEVVVFGGWSAIYDVFLTHLKGERLQFGVYWTSSPGQVDISEETEVLSLLLKDSRIKHRLFANREFALALSRHMSNVGYLPDTLIVDRLNPRAKTGGDTQNRRLIISLFCSPFEYKRKNILNSLLAVSMLSGDYVLYLNGLSKDEHYGNVLKSLKIRYRDFGWMAEKKYQNTLEKIDLGLQVSFAETFNHVAAEHMIRGIPVITSCMVPVMDNLSQEVKKRLIVDDSDSPRSITEKIEFLINHPRIRIRIGQAVLKHVRKENEKRVRIARRALKAILDSV